MRTLIAVVSVAVVIVVALAALGWWRGRSDTASTAEAAATTATTTATTTTTTIEAEIVDSSGASEPSEATPAAPPTTRPTEETSPLTPSTAPIEVRSEIPLDQLLIDERDLGGIVDGLTLAPDDVLGTGPIDIERAASVEADTDAELALLLTRSFEAGFSRAFERDDDIVFVQVYRFGSADDAAAYLLDGADTVLARGAEPYAVDPLAGALGFTERDPVTGFTGHAVSFTVGRHHLLVITGGRSGRFTPADARAVATAQLEHLIDLTG